MLPARPPSGSGVAVRQSLMRRRELGELSVRLAYRQQPLQHGRR